VEKMVEVKAPVRFKDLECKLGVLFKSLLVGVSKKELIDTEKIVAINLKREESIVLMDKNDALWELFRDRKGHYSLKRLRNKH
jgi:hypothetical protein